MITKRVLTPLNAVTATTTSASIAVRRMKRLTAMFKRANHSAGSSTFEILGSIDEGTTFIALPLLIPQANTNSQTLTREASTALSSNTTVFRMLEEIWNNLTHIQVKVTEATDGTHTATILIEEEND